MFIDPQQAEKAADAPDFDTDVVLPEGEYRVKIRTAEEIIAETGTQGLRIDVRYPDVEDRPTQSWTFWHTRRDGSIINFGYRRVAKLMKAAGVVPKKRSDGKHKVDIDDFEGQTVDVTLKIQKEREYMAVNPATGVEEPRTAPEANLPVAFKAAD